MLSIIIPTLNEEDYLPFLLESIKNQSFKDYQIIVADAGSRDATLDIAKNNHCIIVPGGLPAKGRNSGAKIAKGELLFFLDADTVLPDNNSLKKLLSEFNERDLSVASFCLEPIPLKKISSFLLDTFYNKLIIATEKILPHAAVGIIIKKSLFEKLNGYDESIMLSEDHELARRAVKLAKLEANKFTKFGIIHSVKILVSDRRFKKDGWIKTGVKYFLCEMHMIFLGPVKSDIFKYKFNHYKSEK